VCCSAFSVTAPMSQIHSPPPVRHRLSMTGFGNPHCSDSPSDVKEFIRSRTGQGELDYLMDSAVRPTKIIAVPRYVPVALGKIPSYIALWKIGTVSTLFGR